MRGLELTTFLLLLKVAVMIPWMAHVGATVFCFRGPCLGVGHLSIDEVLSNQAWLC